MEKQNSEVDSVLLMLQVQRTILTENDWTVQIQQKKKKNEEQGSIVSLWWFCIGIFQGL